MDMKICTDFCGEINRSLSEIKFDSPVENLYEPIAYTLEDGGKRVRPLLMLLSASLFSNDYAEITRRVMGAAIAVEIFHNFTLLHDDIMDSAPTRRGRPTVHQHYGQNRAILSGDAMLILSYDMLSKVTPSNKLLKTFSRAAIEVCEGQQLDMEFEERGEVSLAEYIEMIRLKTASLIAAATKMAGQIFEATPQECDALYMYGENIGLAFQIQDDLLDTYGSSETFGKKIGGDIAEGKQTFLRIVALERADDAQRLLLTRSRDFDKIKKLYDELDVQNSANKEIARYFEIAQSYLNNFDKGRSESLRHYADYLLCRDK